MAIRATLSSGIASAKTTSLFQWDYGQQLEIVSDDLPPIVEVHFACKGMSEAVVMPCSITDGTGIVTIPDSCLEQSTDITAWVYSIEGTQGKTVKTITIPIVSRIRPGRSETIPQGVSDKYTELISQVNDAIKDLKDGTVTVKKAETADSATKATSATNASFANSATSADTATKATNDADGNDIRFTYMSAPNNYTLYEGGVLPSGVYSFRVNNEANGVIRDVATLVADCDVFPSGISKSALFTTWSSASSSTVLARLLFKVGQTSLRTFSVGLESVTYSNGTCSFEDIPEDKYKIYYRKLSPAYPAGKEEGDKT